MNSKKTLDELKQNYIRTQPCFGSYIKNNNLCSMCSRMKDDVWHWCTVYCYEYPEVSKQK